MKRQEKGGFAFPFAGPTRLPPSTGLSNRAARRAAKAKGVDLRREKLLWFLEALGLTADEAGSVLTLTSDEKKRFRASPSPKCRGCGATLTPENNSAAHVIPNALGGRLKPRGLLCRACNGVLDRIADNALVEAFRAWPTLLDIPRDRGNNPDAKMETKDGREVWVSPEGQITLASHEYEVTEIPEGHSVRIVAGDMKMVNNLLRRAAKKIPNFDLDEAKRFALIAKEKAKEMAEERGVQDGDGLKAAPDFTPRAVFGGVATAVWLFLLAREGAAPMDWAGMLNFVKRVQTKGDPFHYFVDGLPGLDGPTVDFCHKIVVRSIPRTGELVAFVEIIGALRVGGVIAKARTLPCTEVEHVYVYDLEERRDRSTDFKINAAVFERQDWRSVGIAPTMNDAEALGRYMTETVAKLERLYHRRSRVTRTGNDVAAAQGEPMIS